MKDFKLVSKNVQISPRKMMVIANLSKNREINSFLEDLKLSLCNNKPTRLIYKILVSSYKQFLNSNSNSEKLKNKTVFLRSVKIDEGPTRKKIFFRAKGRADTVKNRSSHITVLFFAK